MKILKIKTNSGFKMLEKGFEINFLTKTRVDKDSVNDDLLELESGLYYPIETVFIGKNSSGKTTTLELISIAFEILNFGRVDKNHFVYGETFDIEIIFYTNGIIYKYAASYINDAMEEKGFLNIKEESLTKTTLKDSYKKDLSNANYFKLADFKANNGGDTSKVPTYINERNFNFTLYQPDDYPLNYSLFYKILGEKIFLSLVHLFDDSIEYIRPIDDDPSFKDGYSFKRVNNESEIKVNLDTLKRILSKGTIKGINLYALAILTFMQGGHIAVDEIEGSFNRNLIENLILMFNDKTINKAGGSIIYSTHYSELLDLGSRCDNVNVLHREAATIGLKNMSLDYNIRTEMLKSAKFNQNTFDTLINYDRLMDLKDAIRQGK